MFRMFLSLVIAISFTGAAFGAIVLSENIGLTAVSGTTAITANIFQNGSPITFSGTATVRSTSPSSGSGGNNVFFGAGQTFTIAGIDTTQFVSGTFEISFSAFKSTNASTMAEFAFSYSSDGTTFTPIAIPSQPTGTGTSTWRTLSFAPTTIPVASNLRLQWERTGGTADFRLDDIVLQATAVPEPTSIALVGLVGSSGLFVAYRKRRKQLA